MRILSTCLIHEVPAPEKRKAADVVKPFNHWKVAVTWTALVEAPHLRQVVSPRAIGGIRGTDFTIDGGDDYPAKHGDSALDPPRGNVPRRFIDLSIYLENDVLSDPPPLAPRIEYQKHKDTMPEFVALLPGVTPEDFRTARRRPPSGCA